MNRRFRETDRDDAGAVAAPSAGPAAQQLLETTAHSVETIAATVGFGSASTLRERSQRLVITSPRDYRRAFRAR